MENNWKQLTIGDVCYVTDGAHAKVERVDMGVMYLTSKNIGNGELKLENFDYISEESHIKLFTDTKRSQRRLKSGDVLMGIIGTFGNCYVYRENDHFGISSSVAILRANQELLLPEYLYYVISSDGFKAIVDKYKGGSVQGYTNIATLKALPISIPTLEIQKSIINLLLPKDQKIALNKQTSETFEQMAQTLFKSWFVDFDPVFDNLLAKADFNLAKLESTLPEPLFKKAKARLSAINASASTFENKSADKIKASLTALAQSSSPQLSSRNVPETDTTSASILPQHSNHKHFPSELEHNEQLGWIPKGWQVKELSQLVKHQKGFPFKSAWYQDEGHIVVRVSDTTDDSINVNSCNKISEELAAEYSSYALKENDLVIATVGSWPPNYSSVVGKVIRVPTTAEGGLLNQNAVKLTVSTEYSFHQGFLHFNLKSPRFMSYIINRAQGSANQASITLKSIFDFPMLIANDDVMRYFSDQAKFNFDKQNLNDEEIQSLTRLRDTLLPKLISGELQIS